MEKGQAVGKQTSFRFSATAARELEWLVRKLGQTQTTIVEAAIHRLAEVEGYDRDPKELISTLLAHESGHALLVEILLERGLQFGPDSRIEIRRAGKPGDEKVEIGREPAVEILRASPGGNEPDPGRLGTSGPSDVARGKRPRK